MKYVSVCSGIEAATMAWHELGWEPLAFAEIEKFPAAVLAHHYPDVTNEGDFTKIGDKYDLTDGLLVGGTPCQDFSVAGLRAGLDGERGNLSTEFVKLAYYSNAKWFCWENVPGVLSSGSGQDFATILSGFTGCSIKPPKEGWKNSGIISGAEGCYSVAWRVLDAQYFGVAQRRRRVFVVGYAGAWQYPAAVLFERASLQGNPPPSREAGKGATADVAPSLSASGTGTSRVGFNCEEQRMIPEVCGCLSDGAHNGGGLNGQDAYTGRIIPTLDAPASAMKARDYKDATDLVACYGIDEEVNVSENHYGPLLRGGQGGTRQTVACIPINSMTCQGRPSDNWRMGDGIGKDGDPQNTLSSAHHHAVATSAQIRRLTPTECERLQGFPDGFSRIPWRGKSAEDCPDGPRYKALGNSMAVPCMKWIGGRIQMVEVT